MDEQHHPDDERLAAFAAGDGEAGLAAHVHACDRCAALVADLTSLRASLTALPDLVPSRPLQLVPPVAAAPARRGGLPALVHRLFAPAMAAGAALVLVGSVGMAAAPGQQGTMSAGAGAGGQEQASAAEEAPGVAASESYVADAARSASPAFAPQSASGDGQVTAEGASPESLVRQDTTLEPSQPLDVAAQPAMPWLAITITGTILLIVSLILRWTIVPRAPYPPIYPGA